MIDIGRTFPIVRRELNSPSVVNPVSKGKQNKSYHFQLTVAIVFFFLRVARVFTYGK